MEIRATTYKTIIGNSTGIFKDKGSKFLSFAYPVKTENEIKYILDSIKKEYFDARHHCYAYRLGAEKKIFRLNDDGEPAGTAGKPIFGQIQSFDLTNLLIVVVRYFGGTLLGTSGLIQAYKISSANAIENAKIQECQVFSVYSCSFNYIVLNDVMKLVKDYNIPTSNQNFNLNCSLDLKIPKEQVQTVLPKLKKTESITIDYLYDE